MTRDELLNHLRRELSSQAWSELRPDSRLADFETDLDDVAERLFGVRSEYADTADEDLFRALDDLAASLSYLRIEFGRLFSDATRLGNELRRAVRRSDREDTARQISIDVSSEAAEESEQTDSSEPSAQRELFS